MQSNYSPSNSRTFQCPLQAGIILQGIFNSTCRSPCAIIFFTLLLYRQPTLPKAFPGQVLGCPPGAGTEPTTLPTQGAGGKKPQILKNADLGIFLDPL